MTLYNVKAPEREEEAKVALPACATGAARLVTRRQIAMWTWLVKEEEKEPDEEVAKVAPRAKASPSS